MTAQTIEVIHVYTIPGDHADDVLTVTEERPATLEECAELAAAVWQREAA